MPEERIHVLFAVSTLSLGGAERVVTRLLRHFNREKFKLTLMVEQYGPLLPLVPGDVDVIKLGFLPWIPQMLLGPFLVARVLGRLRPQVIVSNLINMDFYCAFGRILSRSKARLVIVDHIPLSLSGFTARSSRIIRKFVPAFYPFADHLVSVSYGCMRDLDRVVSRIEHKHSTIYNPGWDDSLQEAAKAHGVWEAYDLDPRRKVLLSIGRIAKQKDHRTLLVALRTLKEKYATDAQLLIVGDGDVTQLRLLADQQGIADRVKFCGTLLNPYPLYKRADAFVLSSAFEGLGLVIIEAMALECPVVSTDCPHGPAEVLEGGKCGVLVPVGDPDALANAIHRVLTDKELSDGLVARARMRADAFRAELSTTAYETLIVSLLHGKERA